MSEASITEDCVPCSVANCLLCGGDGMSNQSPCSLMRTFLYHRTLLLPHNVATTHSALHQPIATQLLYNRAHTLSVSTLHCSQGEFHKLLCYIMIVLICGAVHSCSGDHGGVRWVEAPSPVQSSSQ